MLKKENKRNKKIIMKKKMIWKKMENILTKKNNEK